MPATVILVFLNFNSNMILGIKIHKCNWSIGRFDPY
jgi:hypothetical protein